MSSPAISKKQHFIPVVVRDPRYKAGRATIGEQTSLDVFATLLQEAIFKYGSDNGNADDCDNTTGIIETAPAYYEYGNALLRYALRQQEQQLDEHDELTNPESKDSSKVFATTVKSSEAQKSLRETIAAAAEQRAKKVAPDNEHLLVHACNQEGTTTKNDTTTTTAVPTGTTTPIHTDDNKDEETYDLKDDIELALEMMETSWSILDAYEQNKMSTTTDSSSTKRKRNYDDWVTEQIPRVLTGIGDTFAALQRHADAVDAYLRALEHRQTILDHCISNRLASITTTSNTANSISAINSASLNDTNEDITSQVQLLKYRRQVVEVTILLVEELLACGNDHDIQTTESKAIIVSKGNVIDYARGYYDRARDELQETVLLLGQVVAIIPIAVSPTTTTTTTTTAIQKTVQEEKENICFVATMVMGAGTALAEIDDQEDPNILNDLAVEPKKKKSKSKS
jgi:tetratricopeptide (TPR) repeat protein